MVWKQQILCPLVPEIEKVPALFEFHGPVQTDFVDLFKMSRKYEIPDLYRTFKKFHKDVFVK